MGKFVSNGILYELFDKICIVLKCLNLVELFKLVAASCGKDGEAKYRSIVAIDIFMILKWLFLIILIVNAVQSSWAKWAVVYLLFMNLFTYFYYQVWGSSYDQFSTKADDNRRFLNTLLAIGFYVVCYSYLYFCHFYTGIQWSGEASFPSYWDALYLSISNSFSLVYGEQFMPLSSGVRMLFATQVVNTFLFFVIILTNAIPNHIKKDVPKE